MLKKMKGVYVLFSYHIQISKEQKGDFSFPKM